MEYEIGDTVKVTNVHSPLYGTTGTVQHKHLFTRSSLIRISNGNLYWIENEHLKNANEAAPKCRHEVSDGNQDDPGYAYCGFAAGHAGPHGDWR